MAQPECISEGSSQNEFVRKARKVSSKNTWATSNLSTFTKGSCMQVIMILSFPPTLFKKVELVNNDSNITESYNRIKHVF